MMRVRHRDGAVWEALAGYCRAVRSGDWIHVSGTTASGPDGQALFPGDVGEQTRAAIDLGIVAIEALGGHRSDIVRTRVFLVAGADWEPAARAHADRLGDVEPANTMLYVAGLIGPEFLVEVELEAHIDTDTQPDTPVGDGVSHR